MKILFFTQYFYPEERTAPTNLFNMAKDLNKKGHSVTVLTSIPNHPFGKFYKDYKFKIIQKEIIEGIEIIRIPLYPDHSMSIFKRMLMYISFAISSLVIGPLALRNKNFDLIFTYLPPLTVGVPARFLGFIKKARIIYWMTDLWPENLIATGKSNVRFFVYLISRLEKSIYGWGDKILVNTTGFISNLRDKGVSERKIDIISDYADQKLFFPSPYDEELGRKYNLNKKFNFIYAGNMGKVQGVHFLIRAAEELQNLQNLRLVLIGDGTELSDLKRIVKRNKIKNVIFIPKVPMERVHKYLGLSDVLILHLIDDAVFRMQMPSKLIAYMASSKPILCAFEGVAGKLVNNVGCGLVSEASNIKSIKKQMEKFYKMDKASLRKMSQLGRAEFLKNFTREIQINKLENIFLNHS